MGRSRCGRPTTAGEAILRETLARICEEAGRGFGWVGIAILGVLSFPVAYDAVARSFGAPTIWVFETSLYAFIAAGFLANALALRTGAHFRITFIGHAWPAARPWLDRFALLMTLVFAVVLIYATSRFVLYSYAFGIRSNSLLSVPLFVPQLAMPLGGLALALQTIAELLRDAMPSHGDGDAADVAGSEIGV